MQDTLNNLLEKVRRDGLLIRVKGGMVGRDPGVIQEESLPEILEKICEWDEEAMTISMISATGRLYELYQVWSPESLIMPVSAHKYSWEKLSEGAFFMVRKCIVDSGRLVLEAMEACPKLIEIGGDSMEAEAYQFLLFHHTTIKDSRVLIWRVLDCLQLLGSIRGSSMLKGGKAADMIAVNIRKQEKECLEIIKTTMNHFMKGG
jgi:hypothetical protein